MNRRVQYVMVGIVLTSYLFIIEQKLRPVEEPESSLEVLTERAEKLRGLLDTGLHQLYGLWDEIGEEDCF